MISNKSSGQIIVEYVLLLVVVVGVAALIVHGVASRSKDDPGFLIQAWDNMIKTIGSDEN
jgi:hypothetical protein